MFVTTHTKQFLIVAALIIAVSIGIIASLGLPLGIDFTGGALTEVSYGERPSKDTLETALTELGNEHELGGYSLRATVDENGRDGYILRTRDLTETERIATEAVLLQYGTDATLTRFASIGPVIGQELQDKAVWAIGAVVVVIVLFVAFAFRAVSEPVGSWVYGSITIFALIHDVLVPTALMSILGHTIGAEVDVLFVMAILAVLGYSVNDTIVVFDRVRENLLAQQESKQKEPFRVVVGRSVTQTLVRSVNTSVTTLIALGALYFLGGEVTQNFALVLMAGVIAGIYSSLFIANPLLVYMGERNIAKQTRK